MSNKVRSLIISNYFGITCDKKVDLSQLSTQLEGSTSLNEEKPKV